MPNMQNLNSSSAFIDPIVVYSSADVRKSLKGIDVIEKIVGKPLGRFRVLFPDQLKISSRSANASSW